jgi:PIN domain nuclease of toxin-antitoxin system
LGKQSQTLIRSADVAVRIISLWELWLKSDSGRLHLPKQPLVALVEAQGFRILPLRVEHAEEAANIGAMHPDPYDRLIVGTAKFEHLVLLTRDARILEHAAPVLGNLLMQA